MNEVIATIVNSFNVDGKRGLSVQALMTSSGPHVSLIDNGLFEREDVDGAIATLQDGHILQVDLNFIGQGSPDITLLEGVGKTISNRSVAAVAQDGTVQWMFRWSDGHSRENLTVISIVMDEGSVARMANASLAAKILATGSTSQIIALREGLVPAFHTLQSVEEAVTEVWHNGSMHAGLSRAGMEAYGLVKAIMNNEKELGVFKISTTYREIIA